MKTSKLVAIFLFAAASSIISANAASPKIRVMGVGIYSCNYWYTQVFSIAVNHKAMQSGKSIYPYSSLDEWSDAMSITNTKHQLFEESLDWISGYFAAAERFGKMSPIDEKQTSDVILLKTFDICRAHPQMKFEEAASIAVESFLQK